MPAWLAFDAGSPVTSAAVARAGVVLAESFGPSRQGPPLLWHIDESLRRSAIAPSELGGIVVLGGPGSFTGIRIALATAEGFRAALALPVLALSNLAGIALQTGSAAPSRVLALVDALRDEWFVQEFRREATGWIALDVAERRSATSLGVPPGTAVVAHAGQALPPGLAALPAMHAGALSPAVAVAASTGTIAGLLSAALDPIYLRAFTPWSRNG